jgi:hypothetical protein
MHEFIHIIGLCPDSLSHIDLLDILLAKYQINPYINFNEIIKYVTKRRSSHRVS